MNVINWVDYKNGILENPPGCGKREEERMDSERVTKPWQVHIQLPLQTQQLFTLQKYS